MQNRLKSLPPSSGVYQYFDKSGKLLYIGKAKNLKNRVKSYFRFTPSLAPASNLSARIHKMICEVENFEYIVVESEEDALILENSLIKQLKPKYNILLRDDKTYPYIYIDLEEEFPRFDITRRVVKGRGVKYFGPYSSGAREIIDSIYELFKLVQKKSCLRGNRACLFYQIDRCLAPCEGRVSSDEYRKIVKEAIEVIKDKNRLIKLLEIKMQKESDGLLFEEALKSRDAILKLKNSTTVQSIDLLSNEDLDIFAVAFNQETTKAVGVRIFVRNGRVVSSSNTLFRSDIGFDEGEIYKRLLVEYYLSDPLIVPKSILLHNEFEQSREIEDLISFRYKKKSTILKPQRGKKRQLVEIAYKNAIELLKIKKGDDSLLFDIKELFGLSKTPYNIEIFDNSHLRGEASVGGMVKWDSEFIKSYYRHYNLEAKDEYSQMRETLSRRVESFDKNSPPDLWILDGGETLRRLAEGILKELKVSIDVIAISKEKALGVTKRTKAKANDKIYSKSGEFKLLNSDKRLQFVQKLRDEAHRFAVSFHRKIKRKNDKEISLLKQKGIGEAKLKRLIDCFGTFENIYSATLDELESVIDSKSAKNIFLKS